jgi:hypothetical protein
MAATIVTGAYAQTFLFETDSLVKSIGASDMKSFQSRVINTSASALDLLVIRTNVYIDQGWNSMICVGITCYPPERDTVRVNGLAPSETLHVALDVISTTAGSASVKVTIVKIGAMVDTAGTTFTATTGVGIRVHVPAPAKQPAGADVWVEKSTRQSVRFGYSRREAQGPIFIHLYRLNGRHIARLQAHTDDAPGTIVWHPDDQSCTWGACVAALSDERGVITARTIFLP